MITVLIFLILIFVLLYAENLSTSASSLLLQFYCYHDEEVEWVCTHSDTLVVEPLGDEGNAVRRHDAPDGRHGGDDEEVYQLNVTHLFDLKDTQTDMRVS